MDGVATEAGPSRPSRRVIFPNTGPAECRVTCTSVTMPRVGAADPGPGLSAPTVTVRGDALIRSEPDEAALSITLSALKDGPGGGAL